MFKNKVLSTPTDTVEKERQKGNLPKFLMLSSGVQQTDKHGDFLLPFGKQQINDYPNDYPHSQNERILDEERINQGLRNIDHK